MKLIYILLFILCKFSIAENNYYQILRVPRNAKTNDIRNAFKKLTRKYHPDKYKGDINESKQMFIEIATAYEVLRDPNRRRIYDIKISEIHYGSEDQWRNFYNFPDGDYTETYDTFTNEATHDSYRDKREITYKFKEVEKEFMKKRRPFINTKVKELKEYGDIFRAEKEWLLYFFQTYDYNQKYMSESILELSSMSNDEYNIGAINCNMSEELCRKFKIIKTPKLYLIDNVTSVDYIEINYSYTIDRKSVV